MKPRRFFAVRVIAVVVLLVSSGMVAQKSANSPNAVTAVKDYSFEVPASHVWFDTRLDLKKGDRVHVYGGVLACGAGPSLPEEARLPLPSAPVGTLLAKLHVDAKPVLATPDAELPALDPSHLYLGVNGSQCTGKLSARVHVENSQQ